MSEFLPKQFYTGRVIAPAKYYPASGDKKPFISFVLSVNNLLVTKQGNQYKRSSAKITCSYTVQSEVDMVAIILSRISTEANPQELGGESYKSVWVEVEGTERLVQVVDENGNPQKGYYKNLDFCAVNVPDTRLRELYKKEFGNTKAPQEETDSAGEEEQPNVAPKQQPKKVAKQPVENPVAEEATIALGHIEVDPEGNEYRYVGGDPEDMTSWEKVEKKPAAKKLPFLSGAQKKPAPVKKTAEVETPEVSEVLSDNGDIEEKNLFMALTKGKGLAV